MERYPQGPELSRETLEILRTPEQVFDSNIEKARKESERVAERLRQIREEHKNSRGVEFDLESKIGRGMAKTIQITWADWRDQRGMMLSLDPITEGSGPESGVFGYKGRYGLAKRVKNGFEYENGTSGVLTLERLFMVPEGISLIVRPTMVRWAIGADELSMPYGDKTKTLYMGLGFLLLGGKGHKWMHIGMHEAGHLPDENDENKAWTTANRNYASLTRGDKERIRQIVMGKGRGRFDLLEKPFYGSGPTIGKIAKYGLVSHALGGDAKVPDAWLKGAGRTMEEFGDKIIEAQQAFDSFIM